VVADATFSLVFLLGYVTIGLVVTLRRPATDRLSGPCTGRVSGESHELRGLREGQVRRAIQVLGIALMVAGFLLDNSVRRHNRRVGSTSDKNLTSRLPWLLVGIGAVLLVLSSI
jgi:hypothetical protein